MASKAFIKGKTRLQAKSLAKKLNSKYEAQPVVKSAAVNARGLVQIDGSFFESTATADQIGTSIRVKNVGRPSAAVYAPENGGGGSISGGGGGGGGGGGATSFSDLSGTISDAQAPQFLKHDGTRTLDGHLPVGTGYTIDGVDIDVHAADPNAHHAKLHNILDPLHHSSSGGSALDLVGYNGSALAWITPSANPGADTRVLKSDAAGNLTLQSLTTLLITSVSDLTINPVGNVLFPVTQVIKTDNFLSSGLTIVGFNISETNLTNQSGLTIGAILADELHVKVFVADETRVDRGDRIDSKSYGITSRDFTTPGTVGGSARMYFEDSPALVHAAIFTSGDWLQFRVIDIGTGLDVTNIWGTVSSYNDEGSNEQSWLFTMVVGPTSALIKAGRFAVDWGQTGQGIIHYSTLDIAGAPYIDMFKWTGATPYSSIQRLARMGNLKGSYGYGTNTYGFAAGDFAGSWINADATNGFRVMYGATTVRLEITTAGSLNIKDSTGAAVIVLDNAGTSYFALPMRFGLSGGFYQGTGPFSAPTTGLKLWNDAGIGRIGGYGGGVLQWYGDTDGILRAGQGTVQMGYYGLDILAYTGTSPNPTDSVRSISFWDALSSSNGSNRPASRIWGSNGSTLANGIQFEAFNPSYTTNYPKMWLLAGASNQRNFTVTDVDTIWLLTPSMIFGNSGGTIDQFATLVPHAHIIPSASITYDLGSAGSYFRKLYVDEIIAATVTSTTALGGQIWQYDASDMFVRSNSASNRTVFFANPGVGSMSIDVEGSIAVGGLVDGVDLSVFQATYTSHAANANAHHAQSHVLATASALGGDHTVSGLTAGYVLRALTATTASFSQLQFSELGGTSGDILSQYVHISIARTITAIHSFSPATAVAPFTIGVNGQGQTVTGLKADSVNKIVTAGVGLTGGGALTANITLAANFGTPLIGTIVPDSAADAGAATTVARSDHTHAIAAAAAVSLTVATTNTEGVSASFARADHTHAITTSSNPGASAAILASTSAGGLTLRTLTLNGTGVVLSSVAGTMSISDNTDTTSYIGMAAIGHAGYINYAAFSHRLMASVGNYALLQFNDGTTYLNAATGKIVYHRINNVDVMQMGSVRLNPAGSGLISLGDYNRKWSELFVSQLIVDNLVASNVMATIGGRIMVAPTAKMTRDITAAATTIYLDSNLAQPLNELYMAGYKAGGIPQNETMRIISGPVNTAAGEWSYVVTRNIKGQGNIMHANRGFELGDTTGWGVFYSNVLAFNTFAVDNASQARGTYSGKIVTKNSFGNYVGIYSEITLTAGVLYSVSYYVRTVGSTGVQVDVVGPFPGTITLDTTNTNIVGTTAWTRYQFEFTAVSSGIHDIRFYDQNPTAGTFYVDEVVVEAKYAANGSAWFIDDANVNLGYAAGSGYIDLTSLTTIQGHYGPTIAVYSHVTDGGQPKPTVAMGNLRSYVDYVGDAMGWAVGNDLTLSPTGGFVGITGDAVSGLRLFNVTQKMYNAGAEFLRMDTARGISIMSYAQTVSGAGTNPPSINGITFYRDFVGGSKSGFLASVYDTASLGTKGNTTYLSSYDSPVGAGHIYLFVWDEGFVSTNASLGLTGSKPSLGITSSASLSAETVYVSGSYAGFTATATEAGIVYANTGVMISPRQWNGSANTLRSEIANDLFAYNALMLVGNNSAGGDRRVTIYDRLNINGASLWAMQLNINGGMFLANLATPGVPVNGGYLYVNAGALWFRGSSGTNTKIANA